MKNYGPFECVSCAVLWDSLGAKSTLCWFCFQEGSPRVVVKNSDMPDSLSI